MLLNPKIQLKANLKNKPAEKWLYLCLLSSSLYMKRTSFSLVFSFYAHPHFGIMAEPYLIPLLENGNHSLSFQKVGEANVESFLPEVRPHEVKLISILRKLSNQHLTRELKIQPVQLEDQLRKLSEAKDAKGKLIFEQLKDKITRVKEEFFKALDGTELLFEAGKDGYPAFRKLEFCPQAELKMRYTFSGEGIRVEPVFSLPRLLGSSIQILDESTNYAIADNCIIAVPPGLKPSRLRPFGLKKCIEVQKSFASEYSRKIILPDLQAGLAVLEGDAETADIPLEAAELSFSFHFEGEQLGLFEKKKAMSSASLPGLN